MAAYQGASTGFAQGRAEGEALQVFDYANAAYAAANQDVIADYANYDSWRLHQDDPQLAASYQSAFSPALAAAVERSADDPFDEAYEAKISARPNQLFAQADGLFATAQQHASRGGRLQLVVVTAAVGLAFAAWATLLRPASRRRLLLSGLALAALAAGIAIYFTAPTVPV